MRKCGALFILVMIGGFCFPYRIHTQTIAQDTTTQKLETWVDQEDSTVEEIVLDVIEIKGKVDKPGVIIMPKRVEPELGEVELERNFKREVREGVGELPNPDDELGRVEKIKNIKKVIAKERK